MSGRECLAAWSGTLLFHIQPTPMTTILSTRTLILAALLSGNTFMKTEAQSKYSAIPDHGSLLMKRQADSLKTRFTNEGYVVLEESRITMSSETELPVIVNMKKGTWYQIIFIGDIHSHSFEVRMFDFDEHEVVYKKNEWSQDGNIISYPFVPKGTEFHLIKPLQVTRGKKKNLFGYFLLLEKPENFPAAAE